MTFFHINTILQTIRWKIRAVIMWQQHESHKSRFCFLWTIFLSIMGSWSGPSSWSVQMWTSRSGLWGVVLHKMFSMLHNVLFYTMFLSIMGSCVRMRLKPSPLRSRVLKFPSRMSSATARPTAGECCRPWPLNPVAKYMLLIRGWIPMIPFWSNVL